MTIKDEAMEWWRNCEYPQEMLNEDVKELSTILSDVVRVVRCGNCEHYIKSKPHTIRQKPDFCSVWDRHRKPNDFCSEGELKEIRSGANLNPSFEDGV